MSSVIMIGRLKVVGWLSGWLSKWGIRAQVCLARVRLWAPKIVGNWVSRVTPKRFLVGNYEWRGGGVVKVLGVDFYGMGKQVGKWAAGSGTRLRRRDASCAVFLTDRTWRLL